MKERPIIFSGPMVRAILDGRKTMTRRVVKPQPKRQGPILAMDDLPRCPYGAPGDRLYVRETWRLSAHLDGCSPSKAWNADSKQGLVPLAIQYRADSHVELGAYGDKISWTWGRWRPSIHMPRWASRIQLEVTGVRVERVQDTSEADIIEEGCPREYLLGSNWFRPLWDSINAKRGYNWKSNPWVWCVNFEVLP
jgi:hypothetical protein